MALHQRDIEPDHYRVLDVSPDASYEEIREAYRLLAMVWHPDRHPGKTHARAEREMRRINVAWEVLGDPRTRADYDLSLRADNHIQRPAPRTRPVAVPEYDYEEIRPRRFRIVPILFVALGGILNGAGNGDLANGGLEEVLSFVGGAMLILGLVTARPLAGFLFALVVGVAAFSGANSVFQEGDATNQDRVSATGRLGSYCEGVVDAITEANDDVDVALAGVDTDDAAATVDAMTESELAMDELVAALEQLKPPRNLKGAHESMRDSASDSSEALAGMAIAIENGDQISYEESATVLEEASTTMDEALEETRDVCTG